MTYTPEEVSDDPGGAAGLGGSRPRARRPRRRRQGGGEPSLGRANPDRPLARVRRLPRRRHRLAQARGAAARRRDVHDHRPRQPQRDVREQEADRDGGARGRRRGPDRQVPAHLPAPMSTTTPTERRPSSSGCTRSARSARACSPSSPTSRSPRSATSRIRACSRRSGREAATGSSARTTSSGSRRSCGCSATSSYRCG